MDEVPGVDLCTQTTNCFSWFMSIPILHLCVKSALRSRFWSVRLPLQPSARHDRVHPAGSGAVPVLECDQDVEQRTKFAGGNPFRIE
jgi:hypothetical protein